MAEDKSPKKAAALRYEAKKDEAPRVVASGQGVMAQRIIEIAKESGVPIVEDPALTSALLFVELGEEIPVELYEAVARVLAFLYRLDREGEKSNG
ncbi:MAG: EscU/YscU/HrcU family type III secretion system export apparatus switch protein [Synergistota bacterium]|nr:EscU/YscU/HrcU family type III secretion system export apparatus switch protein [Synergistota bacterium]